MHERDIIFRDKLASLVADLYAGEGRDKKLRRTIGMYSDKFAKDAGAKDWADLKARADGPTYDSLLKYLMAQSATMQKHNDLEGVRAFEVLALSLIGRRQYADDLQVGIDTVDRYIAECATNARRKGAHVLPSVPSAKQN
jgi:hypothetical protein